MVSFSVTVEIMSSISFFDLSARHESIFSFKMGMLKTLLPRLLDLINPMARAMMNTTDRNNGTMRDNDWHPSGVQLSPIGQQ